MMTHDLVKGLPKTPLPPNKERMASQKLLVEHSMRQAFFYARKCCRRAIPDDEIFSICYSALKASASNFIAGNLTFFAYSKVYIRGALHRSWKTKDLVPHTPRRNLVDYDHYYHESEHTPSKVGATPIELTVEPNFQTIHNHDLGEFLKKYLASPRLRALHRKVLNFRFHEDLTFEEIGKEIGSSRQFAQETYKNALTILRKIVPKNIVDI